MKKLQPHYVHRSIIHRSRNSIQNQAFRYLYAAGLLSSNKVYSNNATSKDIISNKAISNVRKCTCHQMSDGEFFNQSELKLLASMVNVLRPIDNQPNSVNESIANDIDSHLAHCLNRQQANNIKLLMNGFNQLIISSVRKNFWQLTKDNQQQWLNALSQEVHPFDKNDNELYMQLKYFTRLCYDATYHISYDTGDHAKAENEIAQSPLGTLETTNALTSQSHISK